MKVSIITLGCKVNQYESNYIEANLVNYGYEIVNLSENPDIAIINTCTVTKKSDYQSRQLIRKATKLKCKLIVTGCYVHLNKDKILEINNNALIFNNDIKYKIINMLTNNNEIITLDYSKRARPYIKIQDGCDCFCSYCIVPYVRGRSRSIKQDKIIEQIEKYEKSGFNEVVLTGINLGMYGRDINDNLNNLLKNILKKTNIKRIRLSSIEIKEINEEFLDILTDLRICKHIHIPMQSGDDKILRLMNRRYNSKYYKEKIELIKKKFSNICLGTDIIIGFPGENKQEFENTLYIFKELPFSYAHIFKYSPRPFTKAYNFIQNNSINDIKERYSILKELSDNKKRDFYKSNIGRIIDIIGEEYINGNILCGTSNNYLKVYIQKENIPLKSIINAEIKKIENGVAIADVIK